MLVAGAGVGGQHLDERRALVLWELFPQLGREKNLQRLQLQPVGESPGGLRVAVGVGKVGLDVQNRRAVHQICPRHTQHMPVLGMLLNSQKPHRGQPDGIWPEGRAGGKDADAAVSSQLWRAHGGGPGIAYGLGKLPDQPQMGKLLQPTQRKRVPVFRLEDNQRLQRIDQAALARDTKLGGKVCVDAGNDFDGEGFGHRDPPCDDIALRGWALTPVSRPAQARPPHCGEKTGRRSPVGSNARRLRYTGPPSDR